MARVVILAPLSIEHAALRRALPVHPDIEVAVGGHGKVHFALTTQRMILEQRPQLVICAGTAGSLEPQQLKARDVVVSEVTIEHDYILRFVSRPLPRFVAHGAALETLKKTARFDGFEVHFGPIASGDEDVISTERAQAIRQLTGAIAVAWEGAGGARACHTHKVPFIEIRAISDGADASAMKDFEANVEYGMAHVATVVRGLLESMPG